MLKKPRRRSPLSWERTDEKTPLVLSRKNFRWHLPILAGVATLVLIAGIATWRGWIFSAKSRVIATAKTPPASDSPPNEQKEKSDAVISAWIGFIKARNHLARESMIFEEVGASDRLKIHYDQNGNSLPKKILNPSVSAVMRDAREILLLSFADETGKKWLAPYEWRDDRYYVHWDALTGFCETPWPVLLEKRPTGFFRMRGNFVVPESLSEELKSSDHILVWVGHPDLEKPVAVSLSKTSEAYRMMNAFPRGKAIPAVVEIEWPNPKAARPELTRWIHQGWFE